MTDSTFKRLQTSERGVAEMAERVRDVAALEDPLGRTHAVTELDDGLTAPAQARRPVLPCRPGTPRFETSRHAGRVPAG